MSDTKVNNKVSIIQKLEQSTPAGIVNISEVADRFKNIYAIMNGGDPAKSTVKYEAEKFHFAKLIQDKPELQQCTKLSLYGCFLDMAVNGLSFDPAMKHAYVVAFNANVGSKDSPKWEKRATLLISGYGELHMRQVQKQIKYADNPVLVFDGDQFSYGTREGKVFLEHVALFPRKSDNIIACYIRLERMDGTSDYKVLGIDEIMKFKAFSKDKNSKAWTDGLPGMIQAKTIKHAFRSYPKIRMGDFSQLQTNIVEETETPIRIDYGLNGDHPTLASEITEYANAEVVEEKKETPPAAKPVKDDDFVQQQTNQMASNTKSFDDDDF